MEGTGMDKWNGMEFKRERVDGMVGGKKAIEASKNKLQIYPRENNLTLVHTGHTEHPKWAGFMPRAPAPPHRRERTDW